MCVPFFNDSEGSKMYFNIAHMWLCLTDAGNFSLPTKPSESSENIAPAVKNIGGNNMLWYWCTANITKNNEEQEGLPPYCSIWFQLNCLKSGQSCVFQWVKESTRIKIGFWMNVRQTQHFLNGFLKTLDLSSVEKLWAVLKSQVPAKNLPRSLPESCWWIQKSV